MKFLSFGNITVVELVLVKTRVAPNVAGEVGVAAMVVVAEALVREPVLCDGVDCPVEARPVDALEAAAGEAQLSSVESAVKVPDFITGVTMPMRRAS